MEHRKDFNAFERKIFMQDITIEEILNSGVPTKAILYISHGYFPEQNTETDKPATSHIVATWKK